MKQFGDIRAILQRGASEATWEALCGVLVEQFGEVRRGEEGDLLALLDYCTEHLKSWPKDLPTFAPRSWFQMPSWVISERALTPFFVRCFMARTDALFKEVRRDLATHEPLELPKYIDLSELGTLRWRSGEALDEEAVRRLLSMLRARCNGLDAVVDERVVRWRQFFHDEDAQRWSEALYEQAAASPRANSAYWTRFQRAYLCGRHQVDILTLPYIDPHVDPLHAPNNDLNHRARMLGLFGDRTSLTTLSQLILDVPARLYAGEIARGVLEHEANRRQCASVQELLRVATDYNKPLYDALRESARSTSSIGQELERSADVLTKAMVTRAQVPASLLLDLVRDVDDVDDVALGWILFETSDGALCRMTHGGPRDLCGEEVHITREDAVWIAHPVTLELAGELGDWWEVFAEVGLDDYSVQLDRDIYLDVPALSKATAHGVHVAHPQHIDLYKLRFERDHAHDPPIEERSIWFFQTSFRDSAFVYAPPGYDVEVVFHFEAYDVGGTRRCSNLHSVSVRPVWSSRALAQDDPILDSEVYRIFQKVARALKFGEYDWEPLLP